MKKYFLIVGILFVFCGYIQNSNVKLPVLPEKNTISIIFAGDIMGHSPQFEAAYNPETNSYNYDACFKYVKPYIENADFAIANLEVPIGGKPYSGYPNFSSPDALLDGLKNAGYDILLTANNHVADRGKSGIERTIVQIENRNFKHLGSYLDKNQRDSIYPLLLNVHGIKIAILNCTYGTNNNKVPKPTLVNVIDTFEINKDIRKADKLGADLKILTLHWGVEYELQANKDQQKLARYFVKKGINLIIGSHPHVVQNAQILNGKDSVQVPVFYSLGNSVSNQRKSNTDGGIMVQVEINIKTKKIDKSAFLPVWVYKGVLDSEYQYYLIPTIDFIKNPSNFKISRSDSLLLRYFDTETRNRLSNIELIKSNL